MELPIINYPPKQILDSSKSRQDFEFLLLWLLSNNEECGWSDFKEDPIGISQSTLSNYLKRLISVGYIKKARRGYYKITKKGRERYHQLTAEQTTKKKLSYPPKIIMENRRGYDDWILWMVYNNTSIKWSDFIEDPLSINQSSLSKNLNALMDSGFIKKENKQYIITMAGKTEYAKMIKSYDLDRQSILEEESKRIAELTKKTNDFFLSYGINDDDVKFRFLNNILTLNYEKIKGRLSVSEDDFNKILLYLSINHPANYPEYISPNDFSKEYSIKKTTLDFFVDQIVNENLYSTKFFKLDLSNKRYYFKANEYCEKLLRNTVDNYITKYTYLSKLYENSDSHPSLSNRNLLGKILTDVCGTLFHEELKPSLKDFIPEYIKYLAYKIEAKERFIDARDKLEGFAWQNIPEVFQMIESPEAVKYCLREDTQFYSINPVYFEVLESDYISSEKYSVSKVYHKQEEKSFKDYREDLEADLEKDPNDFMAILYSAMFFCASNRPNQAINLINKMLEPLNHYSEEEGKFIPIAFILSYAYVATGNIKKALDFANKLIKFYPENAISYAVKALVLTYGITYQLEIAEQHEDITLDLIDKAINLEKNIRNKSHYYQLKSNALKYLDQIEDAVEAIDMAIELTPDNIDAHLSKVWMQAETKEDNYTTAINLLEELKIKFPADIKHLDRKIQSFYHKMGDCEKSLQLARELLEKYPNDQHTRNNLLYSLWDCDYYDEALEEGARLVKEYPNEGNFFDSYGEMLYNAKKYKEAIKAFDKAIEIDEFGWYVYETYFKRGLCYKELGEYKQASNDIGQANELVKRIICSCDMKAEWIEKIKRANLELSELEKA